MHALRWILGVIVFLLGLLAFIGVLRDAGLRRKGSSYVGPVVFMALGLILTPHGGGAASPPPNNTISANTTNATASLLSNTVNTTHSASASTNSVSGNTNTSSNSSSPSSSTPSGEPSVTASGPLIPAVVTKDVDGDTIHVRLNGKDETIRMLLIDTPEDVDPNAPVEPYGPDAAAYARRMLPVGKQVYIQEGHPGYTRDKYGRLLAYVWITRTNMYNLDVVHDGLARVAYIYPPNTDYLNQLETAQNYAKSHHLGIWSIQGYVTSDGYNLAIACQWAASHGYSTTACPAGYSSAGPSGSSSSSTGKASSSQTLTVVSSNLHVKPGDYASVTIKTKPGTEGTIEVRYKSGVSHASGLEPKTADSSGLITWEWRVGTHTTPGEWPVIISAGGKSITLTLYVE